MSEPESFLERWSRRKIEADGEAEPARERPADAAPTPPQGAEARAPQKPTEAQPAKPFDIADLPPIESIGADTDVRAFLRPGVPADLTRAALRRAWTSDPAIRDFVGLVENGWDFNDPDGVPGFGRIAAEDVTRLLNQAVGAVLPEPAPPADVASAPPVRDNSAETSPAPTPEKIAGVEPSDESATQRAPELLRRNTNDAASQEDS